MNWLWQINIFPFISGKGKEKAATKTTDSICMLWQSDQGVKFNHHKEVLKIFRLLWNLSRAMYMGLNADSAPDVSLDVLIFHIYQLPGLTDVTWLNPGLSGRRCVSQWFVFNFLLLIQLEIFIGPRCPWSDLWVLVSLTDSLTEVLQT